MNMKQERAIQSQINMYRQVGVGGEAPPSTFFNVFSYSSKQLQNDPQKLHFQRFGPQAPNSSNMNFRSSIFSKFGQQPPNSSKMIFRRSIFSIFGHRPLSHVFQDERHPPLFGCCATSFIVVSRLLWLRRIR